MNSRRTLITTSIIIFVVLVLSVAYNTAINLGKQGILYSDYGKFYQSARFVLTGKDAYTPIFFSKEEKSNAAKKLITQRLPGNLNPPIFTILILPLAYLSYAASLWVWSAISFFCGLLSIYLLHRKILANAGATTGLSAALALAFFVYYPTFATIQFGQITLFLLPMLVGAWLCARDNKSFAAAILLGVAASIKPFFGLFVIYFLVRREWRALFAFIGVVLVSLLVPFILFGKQTFLNYYSILNVIKWSSSSWNASILGVLLRLFGGNAELNVALIPIAGLTEKLYLPLSVLFLLGFIKFLWPQSKIKPKQKCDLDFSVTLVTMLLLSPLAWIYYYPFLIVPLMALWQFTKSNYYPLAMPVLITLVIILSSIPAPLIASGWITKDNVASVFLWSSCYTVALFILIGIFFFLRATLQKQNERTKSVSLSNNILVVLFSIALLFSFLGIMKTTYGIATYGNKFMQQYHIAYFG